MQFGGITLGGAQAGNYTLVPGQQAATITPKPLTAAGLTATDRVYDATTAATLTGTAALTAGAATATDGRHVTGDTVSITGTAAGTFADSHAGTGKTVSVTGLSLTGASADNYSLSPVTTTATITARSIDLEADAQSKTYGDAEPTLTFRVGGLGLVGSDTQAGVLSGLLATATGASATAGTHAITQGSLVIASSDYQLGQFTAGTLTVTKAPLTITADAARKTYGDAEPTLAYTVNPSQLKYTDTASAVSGVTLTTATGASATAGTHTISATGGTAANYTLTLADSTLTVDKAALTVTADAARKTYGNADPTLAYSVDPAQLKYTDTASAVSGVVLSTATGASATAGTHAITATGGTAANYDLTLVDSTLTVDKAALTVTADAKRKTYGDADPTLTYAVDAAQLKYTDSDSVVSGVVLTTATGASATAGTHTISATGGTAANYTLTLADSTLTVDKAALTVTADAARKTYGNADPILAYSVDPAQLKYTDTASAVSGVVLSTATGASATAGTHAITATGGTAANYDLTLVDSTLTVDKAALTITADAKRKTYGDADPTLTYAVDAAQLKYTDSDSVVSGVVLTTATGASATAGTHTISATGGTAANYDLTLVDSTLTVDKAALTVTAEAKRKTYGDADPTLTYAVNAAQLKYTDTPGVVSGVALTSVTGASATAGTHAISGSAGTAANYDVTLIDGVLTVDKAALAVTVDNQRKTYGDTDPTLTYTVNPSQLKYTDTASVVGSVNLSAPTGASATAGTHTITGAGGTAANYDVSLVDGTLTVDKAALAVSAVARRKTYGDADPNLTYTVNTAQLKYTDSDSVVSGVVLTTATGANATAGTHTISATGGTAANYTLTLADSTLTVDKAALTVTAHAARKTYGNADPSLTYAVDTTQLKYTDTADVVRDVQLSTATGAAATAGSHPITATGGSADNYAISVAGNTLTVDKAALTVTADAQRKVYGATDPTLTYSVDPAQLRYTDTLGVVSGINLSTATGVSATAGTHTIAISGGTAANYAITLASGLLAVDKAPLVVAADGQRKVYGEADPTLTYRIDPTQLRYTDTVAVVTDVNLSTSTGAAATAGAHLISGSAGIAANYDVSVAPATLTVDKAPLNVTANNARKVYGDADPSLAYTVNAAQLKYTDAASVVSGVNLSAPTGAAATAGTHVVTASGGAAANYAITTANGTLTVDKAAITVTANDARKVYGDAEPSLAYTVNAAQLKYTDAASVVSGVNLSALTGAAATAGTHVVTASGGAAANYTVTTANGTLTVDKASLTVTANDARKVYGDADPALAYTVNAAQLKYADAASVVSGVNLSAPTGAAATAGTHVVTASGGAAANYVVITANGTLTVDKAALTVTANDARKVYGDAEPSLAYTVNAAQLKYTDAASVVSGVNLSAPTGAAATAGTHVVAASGGAAANYAITTANGTLTVDKAALTVSANDARKVYGDADPALAYTVNAAQLKYTDAASVVSGVNLSAPTGAAATAGTHVVTASGGAAANYTVITADGTLTVDKAALTVTANDARKVYGDADPALAYTVNAAQLKYTDAASVVSGVNLSAPTGAAATAGTHVVAASGGAAANYAITTANGTLTVDKAALTVSANDARKVYGDADPALAYTVNAAQLKYADAASVVSGVNLSAPTGAAATAGTHVVAASGGTATNYDVTSVNGTLTVDKAALTVTANDARKVYGDADPALAYTVNAAQLKYADAASVVSGVNLSAPTGAAATAGTHVVTASGGAATNYAITTANGTLTVDKAALTVSANDARKVYGDADPSLAYTVNAAQLKYADAASVVSGVNLSAPTGAAATAGTHVVTASGGAAANYAITTADSTLTVDKAALTVTANDARKVYGDADPALAYTVNAAQLKYADAASVVSGVNLSAPTGAAATAGTHVVAASGGAAANYAITTANGTLTVDKAALTVSANDARKVYGDADPALAYTVNAAQLKYTDAASVVSGVNLSAPTGAAATAGTHVVTASGGAAANYTVITADGTLTVDKAALTVSANDARKVYGDADPSLAYTVNAAQLKYTDAASVVSGVNLSAPTGAAATAGTHVVTASGGAAANYAITTTNGTLTVDKAALTVSANDARKVYGDADPSLAYTVNAAQLKYADAASIVSGVNLSAPTGAAATAGTHVVTASGGAAANYTVTTANGTLTVDKASLTVTANDARKVYGDAEPSLAYTVNAAQLKYTDAASVVSGVNLSAPTGAAATAGTHVVAASGGAAANYTVTTANGTLTVDKAALTVSANDARKVYGDADPSLAYTVNAAQLKYADAASVVSGVNLSAPTGSAATAGTHVVAASGGAAANYAITTANGTLTVDKAALTVSANDARKVYGDVDPSLAYTVNAAQLKYADAASVVSGVNLSAPTGAAATAGTHVVAASGGAAANYTVTTANGTLTVDKAALTVSANDARKVYGDADPALAYTVNAAQLKYADAASVVSGVNLSAPTGAAATAGTHVVAASGGAAANYAITTANGTLTVDKAALTVSANDARKVYGDADPALAYTVNAAQLKYADAASVVSGVNLSAPTGAAATAGTHVVTASGGAAANYAITTANGTLTVDKAALTVTANDKSKTAGEADPTLTYEVNAASLRYGDTLDVVRGVKLTAPLGAGVPVGTYTIAASDGVADNYNLQFASGTLTVKASVGVKAETLSNTANGVAQPSMTVGTSAGSTNPAGSLVVRDGGVANAVVPPTNPSGNLSETSGANAASNVITASSDSAGGAAGRSGSLGGARSTASSERTGSSDPAPASVTFGITEDGAAQGNGLASGSASANTVGANTASDARPAVPDTTAGKASSTEQGAVGQAGTSTGRAVGTSATRKAADEAASPESTGKLVAVRPQTQVAFGAGQSVSFEAASAFVQPPNTSVSYSVTLPDGRPLPAWVKFDPVVGTLSGKAPSDWTGKLEVIVTAMTESGVAASARVSFEPNASR